MKFKVWYNNQWVQVSHRQVRRRIGTHYQRMIGPFGPEFGDVCLFDDVSKGLSLEEVEFRCNHGHHLWYTIREKAWSKISRYDKMPTFAQIMALGREPDPEGQDQ